MGGLACPNLRNYIIASQLTQLNMLVYRLPPLRFCQPSLYPPPPSVMSYIGQGDPGAQNYFLLLVLWLGGRGILTQASVDMSPQTPLWRNPNLPVLIVHLDPPWWGRFGVTHHIVEDNNVVPFATLGRKHGIENKLFF